MEQEVNSPSCLSNDQYDSTFEDMTVIMHDASCSWSSSDEKDQNLVLNRVNLCLPKGYFVAVIGEVKYLSANFDYSTYLLLFYTYNCRGVGAIKLKELFFFF